MLRKSTPRAVRRADGTDAFDHVVVEEPMEIRIERESIAVTMRTPGDDLDLAAGFLFTETAIRDIRELESLGFAGDEEPEPRNVVVARPAAPHTLDVSRAKRSFYAASSCGLCGKATLDAIGVSVKSITREEDDTTFALAHLLEMPARMRAAQPTFDATGGLHAAALFAPLGELLAVREDIGRHNATDKVIGHYVRRGEVPLHGRALLVSGRAGFEIVQKSAVARVPLLAAVSAPSSLAIDLADRLGITLLAFLRPPKVGIYTHSWRVTGA